MKRGLCRWIHTAYYTYLCLYNWSNKLIATSKKTAKQTFVVKSASSEQNISIGRGGARKDNWYPVLPPSWPCAYHMLDKARSQESRTKKRISPGKQIKEGKKKKKHRIALLALVPNKESLGHFLAVADSQINFIADICNTKRWGTLWLSCERNCCLPI